MVVRAALREAVTPGMAGPAADAAPDRGWMPTRAFGRSIVITGLLLVAAVVLGRVDLVVLAAPFALGSALALARRPVGRPAVRIAVAGQLLAEGGELAATASVDNQDAVGYDLVVL